MPITYNQLEEVAYELNRRAAQAPPQPQAQSVAGGLNDRNFTPQISLGLSDRSTNVRIDFQHTLHELRLEMTSLIVSNRISSVRWVDKIIVMNEGKVEAEGRHEELLALSPTYQKFVQLQSQKGDSHEPVLFY